jgi:hypothetical protein
LTDDEIVHHKDGDKGNNEISNLQITVQVTHGRLHHTSLGISVNDVVLNISGKRDEEKGDLQGFKCMEVVNIGLYY